MSSSPAVACGTEPAQLSGAAAELAGAFSRFQEHCERLESVHRDLRAKLDQAQLRLEEKNRELAVRLTELEVMRERLSGILESITDGVLLVDGQGVVVTANAAAVRLCGGEVEGLRLTEVLPALVPVLEAEDGHRTREVVASIAGLENVLMASAVPVRGISRLVDGHRVLAFKDVTEHRRLQERLARADRLAALGQVAANVAHEIRNPLGAIEGFARLLEGDLRTRDAAGAELARKTVYAAQQLNGVVSNLLNYARDPASHFQLFDLVALVREVLAMLEPRSSDRGVTVLFEVTPPALTVPVDGVQFRQVVANLVVNALEACPSRRGGCVEVGLEADETELCLRVADNGRGIEDAALPRLFEPFFTRKQGGVGLGLAMCHRIVEAHGGRITAANRAAGGAVFVVTLPRRPMEAVHD
jgi:signal transduction histidine kinase